ncbi:hypothetical protein K1Y38_01395 [Serratia marcescens]|uniref:hypothetical protein n=1 Tax=Serratia TaxID=613 RepID=UPI00092C283C|nr:hypothetical protein [Serratia marcescens]MCW6011574.1 hypothetical protein [Serratia marcescens]OJH83553.1 hypothetical protein ASJ78_02931 [Serratia marcescens]
MGKAANRAFREMKEKIKRSKHEAAQQAKQMRYNSKPLENVGITPPSNITYATYK